ncbi:MAG TPA: MFS transporter [Polyangiales bacterium]|nr:MFS transporter [Polyangiales bacterium]
MKSGYFRGWEVVAGCFVMAMISWGLGFYGTGLYLAYLVGERGFAISAVSGGITAYFWLSALMIMTCGPLIDRAGPRLSVSIGAVAMVLAVSAIAHVTAVWQFYAALGLMAVAWTTMTSSAINTILAPWFLRKRGVALSLALTGASFGGIAVVPLVTASANAYGQRNGMMLAAAGCGAIAMLVAWRCFVPDPSRVGQFPDGDPAPLPRAAAADSSTAWPLRRVLSTPAFLSICISFSIALTVQVGFLTHQISMLQPALGAQRAAWAVGLTTISAVLGRLVAGALMDFVERRALCALNFMSQVLGLLLLASAHRGERASLTYAACVLCGLSVGNAITFSGLLIQREFPPEQFNRVNRLSVGIGQICYACGPLLMGFMRELSGGYEKPLYISAAVGTSSAIIIWFGRPRATLTA